MKVEKRSFGGNGASLYRIENDYGMVLEASDFGGRIVRLLLPDNEGELRNIVLGFGSAEEYSQPKSSYFGATIGRVAGRIRDGKATINQKKFQLNQNEGNNTLHGGVNSFDVKLWECEVVEKRDEISLVFSYKSPDGENGFPGELNLTVEYVVTNQNEWIINYQGTTDASTFLNPTNHVYFNLTGDITKPIDNHRLYLAADKFAVLDENFLPTGELRAVNETPFDFLNAEGQELKRGFQSDYPQNTLVDGYDHGFVLKGIEGEKPQGVLKDDESKIMLELYTESPSVVVYTTNIGENSFQMFGETVKKHRGITFETQVLPDAINHEGFGNIYLNPDEVFTSSTRFKFSY